MSYKYSTAKWIIFPTRNLLLVLISIICVVSEIQTIHVEVNSTIVHRGRPDFRIRDTDTHVSDGFIDVHTPASNSAHGHHGDAHVVMDSVQHGTNQFARDDHVNNGHNEMSPSHGHSVPADHGSTHTGSNVHVDLPGQHGNTGSIPVVHRETIHGGHNRGLSNSENLQTGREFHRNTNAAIDVHVDLPGMHGNTAGIPVVHRENVQHGQNHVTSDQGFGRANNHGNGNTGIDVHVDLPGMHGNTAGIPVVHRENVQHGQNHVTSDQGFGRASNHGTSAVDSHVDLPGEHGNNANMPVVHRENTGRNHGAVSPGDTNPDRNHGRPVSGGDIHVGISGQLSVPAAHAENGLNNLPGVVSPMDHIGGDLGGHNEGHLGMQLFPRHIGSFGLSQVNRQDGAQTLWQAMSLPVNFAGSLPNPFLTETNNGGALARAWSLRNVLPGNQGSVNSLANARLRQPWIPFQSDRTVASRDNTNQGILRLQRPINLLVGGRTVSTNLLHGVQSLQDNNRIRRIVLRNRHIQYLLQRLSAARQLYFYASPLSSMLPQRFNHLSERLSGISPSWIYSPYLAPPYIS